MTMAEPPNFKSGGDGWFLPKPPRERTDAERDAWVERALQIARDEGWLTDQGFIWEKDES